MDTADGEQSRILAPLGRRVTAGEGAVEELEVDVAGQLDGLAGVQVSSTLLPLQPH